MIIYSSKPLRPRQTGDWYPTDDATVRSALALAPHMGICPRILDAGAGTGPWGTVARELWPAARVVGAEMSSELPTASYDIWRNGDFLTMPWYEQFDLVTGNPPFYLAEEFVRRGLDLVPVGGTVLYLFRLAFLAGQARAEGLYAEHPLAEAAVLTKRPSFTPDGKTDNSEYAIFRWVKGYRGPTQLTHILPTKQKRAVKKQLEMELAV